MDFFFLFKGLYLLLLFSLTVLVFLWILGASQKRNDTLQTAQRTPRPLQSTPSHPSDRLLARRLSFSSASATPTPPAPSPPPSRPPARRRVTFSLTPEQHRAEALKAQLASRPPLVELFPSTSPPLPPRSPARRPRPKPASPPPPQPPPTAPSVRLDTDEQLKPPDQGALTAELLTRVRAEGNAMREQSLKSEEKLRMLEGKRLAFPETEGDQQVAGFFPLRKTEFANGPVAFRGFEGEAVMFAGRGRKRRAASTF